MYADLNHVLVSAVQLGMLQEAAEQAQRQDAAAKAVLKAAQVRTNS